MNISSKLLLDKPLSDVSTFGIGGPARYYMEARSIEEIREAICFCKEENIHWFVLGKGSNSLFDDRGFNGLVIANKISFCNYKENVVSVGAGYSFSLLGAQTAKKGFAGLEFASGIPGSVGGAVYMNAGANGKETCESLTEVEFLNDQGEVERLEKNKLEFRYRFSSFQKMKGVILSATFELIASLEARKKQLEIVEYRTKTQPYSDKSAGCVFRNPVDLKAGALIESCGLKGYKIGGAEVSFLHGNFIVNKGGAKSRDILELARYVQEIVKKKTGATLEMEVRVVPYDFGGG